MYVVTSVPNPKTLSVHADTCARLQEPEQCTLLPIRTHMNGWPVMPAAGGQSQLTMYIVYTYTHYRHARSTHSLYSWQQGCPVQP